MKHPTLYKKTAKNKIQTWSVEVQGNAITTTFGQLNGKLQVLSETISEGKNLGKVNETTPEQQAESEAQSRFEKQLKKGYVSDLEAAEKGEIDSIIEGGVAPMLAPNKVLGTDENLKKKIKFPAFVQPKLDGMRCLAVVKDGTCSLWTRTRKQIHSLPHIEKAIENLGVDDIIFDGELYNHEYHDKFSTLISHIRKDDPTPEAEVIQYHIYDIVDNAPFSQRNWRLYDIMRVNEKYLFQLSTVLVGDFDEIEDYAAKFIADNYEGAMVRNDTPYESGKRSSNLQKVKKFDETEFEIVGVNNGRGKYSNCAVFTCKCGEGTFDCLAPGSVEEKESWLKSDVVGKMLTVKHFGYTDTNNQPRFPIAKAVRDYE